MRAVITVIGHDKVGIIAKVSNILAEAQINILDISQTIMQNMFTMIMLVDVNNCPTDFDTIAKKLETAGEKMEVSIKIQHEDVFNSMHRI